MADPSNRSLARWMNEGGADEQPHLSSPDAPPMTPTEMTQLRIRVIALETVMIQFLSGASDDQRAAVRAMAEAIRPQAGAKPHPLTQSAALHINHLVDRAEHWRA